MQAIQPNVARAMAFKPAASRRTLVVRNSAVAPAVQLPHKSSDGADKGSKEIALKVAEDSARGLVHRYMVMVQQNARRGTASTLTKGEVRGGGKKPYAQKGTGNARRGSSTSPLFPGGGVTFGPKPKDWKISMNKKERRLALATALQSAATDMIVVDSIAVEDKKTKSLLALLEKLGVNAMERKVLLITKEKGEDVVLAGRNIAKLAMNTADCISVFDVLNADHIIVDEAALAHIQSFYGPKQQE